MRNKIPELKKDFVERIEKLLTDKKDLESYWKILKSKTVNSIRCNNLKISPKELIMKLEKYNWKMEQPWKENPEVIIILGKKPTGHEKEMLINENLANLQPGELGRCLEHLLGYFYVQELASMLPIIALNLKEERFFDCCAAPGSKTTQASSVMKNKGTIIANESSMGRMRILSSNLERCGVTNTIVVKKDGRDISRDFKEKGILFDKILLDVPCSGEGTLRSSYKTYIMWNLRLIKSLAKIQKKLFETSFGCLKVGGEMIYSTCTHAPEENEAIVSEMLELFGDSIEIVDFKLPIKTREGILKWKDKKFDSRVKLCKRIYPQDNNTEGFFVSKFKRVKNDIK